MRLIDATAAAELISERHGIPLAELVDTFADISTIDFCTSNTVKALHEGCKWVESKVLRSGDGKTTLETYTLRCARPKTTT